MIRLTIILITIFCFSGNVYADVRDIAAAKKVLDSMIHKAGVVKFFSLDASDPKVHIKYMPAVIEYEFLTGTQPSEKDKERYILGRKLASLSEVIERGLTSRQTGFFDSFLDAFDDVVIGGKRGVGAKAAHALAGNLLKHALFDKQETGGEMDSFTDACGSINDQISPLLIRFGICIETEITALEALRDSGNPYIGHIRYGGVIKRMKQVVAKIRKKTGTVLKRPSIESDSNGFKATKSGKFKYKLQKSDEPVGPGKNDTLIRNEEL